MPFRLPPEAGVASSEAIDHEVALFVGLGAAFGLNHQSHRIASLLVQVRDDGLAGQRFAVDAKCALDPAPGFDLEIEPVRVWSGEGLGIAPVVEHHNARVAFRRRKRESTIHAGQNMSMMLALIGSTLFNRHPIAFREDNLGRA